MNSPVQAMLLSQLMQKIASGAGGGAGMGGPVPGPGPIPAAGGPGGGAPGGSDGLTVASPADAQGDELSKQLSIMRIADPSMIAREIDEINSRISTLLNHSNRSLPSVALGLSKALTGIHTALREANKAAQAMAVAGPPINNSILPPGFPTGAPAGAGNPGQPGMPS